MTVPEVIMSLLFQWTNFTYFVDYKKKKKEKKKYWR